MEQHITALTEEDFRRWNATTFHKLYKLYYKALVVYACRMLQDPEEGEDTVQELFSLLWEREMHFDNETQLRAYLYRSVRNMSIKQLRHQKVVTGYANDQRSTAPEHEDRNPDDRLFVEEVYRQLLLTVEAMPQRQREVFEKHMDGMSNAEIAEAMRISTETVKAQKRKAMKLLREKLNDRDFMLITIFMA